MKVSVLREIKQLDRQSWAKLQVEDSPFLNYEFLMALETFNCVGESTGWLPHHLRIDDEEGIVGFMPVYKKYNSYGELVFDWSWADAYHQSGLEYYPKLVSAIPYTPVTGARLLTREGVNRKQVINFLVDWLKQKMSEHGFSGFHSLFPMENEMEDFCELGLFKRLGCQFHWLNREYESFEHFLSFFSSRKRKNVKKERQNVAQSGFDILTLHGNEIAPELWPIIYDFYQITFYKKSGFPTFTLEFFQHIANVMPSKFLVNLVSYRGKFVASAILYRDSKTLYGRHWGSYDEFKNLHFETCYYQGLDYAIKHKLERFEPGAQGEHKISRGFLPTATWSVHMIDNPVFSGAISDFCQRETHYMQKYMDELFTSSPYKS